MAEEEKNESVEELAPETSEELEEDEELNEEITAEEPTIEELQQIEKEAIVEKREKGTRRFVRPMTPPHPPFVKPEPAPHKNNKTATLADLFSNAVVDNTDVREIKEEKPCPSPTYTNKPYVEKEAEVINLRGRVKEKELSTKGIISAIQDYYTMEPADWCTKYNCAYINRQDKVELLKAVLIKRGVDLAVCNIKKKK